VPIGPPPASAVRGRSLFAGDAANLVMATNGGGIPTAMISGRDAGVVAAGHVKSGAPLSPAICSLPPFSVCSISWT